MPPLSVKIKGVKFSYHVEEVFEKDIPSLQHGNDGLIYTCVNTPYMAGTDPNMYVFSFQIPLPANPFHSFTSLKWKPPSENSIDFKLILRFLPSRESPRDPDYYSKPIFELHVWGGGRNYEFYDVMHVTDDEWER